MAGIPWTSEEEEMLRQLSAAGVTCVEASRVLKSRSKHSIDQKAKNMGLPMGMGAVKPEIDRELFRQMVKGK